MKVRATDFSSPLYHKQSPHKHFNHNALNYNYHLPDPLLISKIITTGSPHTSHTQVYTHAHTLSHMYMHIHTRTHMRTHARTHTHTHIEWAPAIGEQGPD